MVVPGRKMALIPIEMLQQIRTKPDLTPLKNPNQDQLVKSMGKMDRILNDSSLPEDIKSNRVSQTQKDLSIYSNKIMNQQVGVPPPPPPSPSKSVLPEQNPLFTNSFPKTFQTPANHLLTTLKNNPGVISWNADTNEVTIDGRKLPGSNIIDLIGDVLRNRKSSNPPEHSDAFLRALAKLNVPEELVKNKSRIAKLRSYKRGGDDDDDDDDGGMMIMNAQERQVKKAKSILERKRKLFRTPPSKIARKKRYTWLTM